MLIITDSLIPIICGCVLLHIYNFNSSLKYK